jgi:hypothetical protein
MSTCFCEKHSAISVVNKGSVLLDEIKIRIEVKGYFDGIFRNEYCTMEEEVTFGQLDFTARHSKIKILPNIPRIQFWQSENGELMTSFQDINLVLVNYKVNNNERGYLDIPNQN